MPPLCHDRRVHPSVVSIRSAIAEVPAVTRCPTAVVGFNDGGSDKVAGAQMWLGE